MANELGYCVKCNGDLCITSRRSGVSTAPSGGGQDTDAATRPTAIASQRQQIVACMRCGHIHEDHPMMAEIAAALARELANPPQPPVVKLQDYPANDRDRLLRLEKTVVEQGKRIDVLVATLTARPATLERAVKRTG